MINEWEEEEKKNLAAEYRTEHMREKAMLRLIPVILREKYSHSSSIYNMTVTSSNGFPTSASHFSHLSLSKSDKIEASDNQPNWLNNR